MNWNEIFKKGAKYKPLNEIYLENLLKEIEKYSKNSDKVLIDLGCGTGNSLLKFVQKGYSVIGVDISDIALKEAENLLKKENVKNYVLHCMDLDEFKISEKADIVFSKLTIAFVQDKPKFIENVKKIMKDNGVFVLITPVLYSGIQYTKEDKPGIAVKYDEIYNLLKESFNNVDIFDHDYFGERGDNVTFILR